MRNNVMETPGWSSCCFSEFLNCRLVQRDSDWSSNGACYAVYNSNCCTPGADPENFSRGGPTLSKKEPITLT